jgi:hypothetical protein
MLKLNSSLACALVASLLVSACGGGVEVGVVVPPLNHGPDFDVIAWIDGQRLSGVDVFPGEVQTISVVAGDSFELDASGPVYWDLSAGNSADVPASAGSTFLYRGAALTETSVGATHLVLAVSSSAAAGSTVPITVTVTSQFDPNQFATIDLLVRN